MTACGQVRALNTLAASGCRATSYSTVLFSGNIQSWWRSTANASWIAFSGLSRGFAWTWKTDFLWGLPENRIDEAPLWEKNFLADRNRHNVRQRPVSVRFPSWTWAGWKGAVKYQPGNFDLTKVEYTKPCVGDLLGPSSSPAGHGRGF